MSLNERTYIQVFDQTVEVKVFPGPKIERLGNRSARQGKSYTKVSGFTNDVEDGNIGGRSTTFLRFLFTYFCGEGRFSGNSS